MARSLHELSLSYIDGEIDKEHYRALRREKLKALLEHIEPIESSHLYIRWPQQGRQHEIRTSIYKTVTEKSPIDVMTPKYKLNKPPHLRAFALLMAITVISVSYPFITLTKPPFDDVYSQIMLDNKLSVEEPEKFFNVYNAASRQEQLKWQAWAKDIRSAYQNTDDPDDKAEYRVVTALLEDAINQRWDEKVHKSPGLEKKQPLFSEVTASN